MYPQNQPQQINIKINDDTLAGKYANAMQVSHTKEEFVLDFLSILPPNGIVNARIFISPGHLKRIIGALKENLERYEGAFGKIEEAEAPKEVGFTDK